MGICILFARNNRGWGSIFDDADVWRFEGHCRLGGLLSKDVLDLNQGRGLAIDVSILIAYAFANLRKLTPKFLIDF